jgi:hypothetical protein
MVFFENKKRVGGFIKPYERENKIIRVYKNKFYFVKIMDDMMHMP